MEEIKIDVAVLKTELEAIKNRLEKIENNHLPHIEARLNSIERKVAYYSGGIAILVLLSQIFFSRI